MPRWAGLPSNPQSLNPNPSQVPAKNSPGNRPRCALTSSDAVVQQDSRPQPATITMNPKSPPPHATDNPWRPQQHNTLTSQGLRLQPLDSCREICAVKHASKNSRLTHRRDAVNRPNEPQYMLQRTNTENTRDFRRLPVRQDHLDPSSPNSPRRWGSSSARSRFRGCSRRRTPSSGSRASARRPGRCWRRSVRRSGCGRLAGTGGPRSRL
jgi:hypothetical protein